MLPKVLALVATVLMLMSLGFFVLGSTPLLILKHDVPMDSKVVRQVFHYCYRLVAVMAASNTPRPPGEWLAKPSSVAESVIQA